MSASVLRSVMCEECLGLGCFGNKGDEGTPEEPAFSGNVSTISIKTTGNTSLFRINFHNVLVMETSNSTLESIVFHLLVNLCLSLMKELCWF